MRDEDLRALERAHHDDPDDLVALRRWADARARAGLELLPAKMAQIRDAYSGVWRITRLVDADRGIFDVRFEPDHTETMAAFEAAGAAASVRWNQMLGQILDGGPSP